MSLTRNTSVEIPLAVKISNCDENKFQKIVYEFIERIANEVSLYDDNSEFNLSASAFHHIELQIQARRIEKALQLCIAKVRSVFVVSQLIEYQREHLKLFFQPLDVERIERFAQKWFQSDLDPLDCDFNADLNQCLDASDRTDINIKVQPTSNSSGEKIVLMLTELIHFARYRIETDASTDMARQKVLHQLWATNTKNLQKINQIWRDIEEDQLKISKVLAVRQKEIERYEFEKERLCYKNTTVLNRLIIESNKAMAEICDIGKCHQIATTEAVMRAKEMFDTLRKNDVCEENEAIQKKINLENSFKDFLKVYDAEIGARNFKLRNYRHVLRDESKTLTDWQEKYKIQEVLFNEIQANKEAEEEQRREERILLFMMNRVARIIQRQYRRILAQRKAKKKGKGKKGGKSKK